MYIKTLLAVDKVVLEVNPNNCLGMNNLFTRTPYSKLGYTVLHESWSLKNIEVRSFIYSLNALQFPSSPIEASESEIALTNLEYEWKSERFHLNSYLTTDNINWIRRDIFSLINPSPVPYREFDVGDINLGANGMLAFQLQNVGYGVMSGGDKVYISADLERTVQIEKIKSGIPSNYTLPINAPYLLLDENLTREGFTIHNPSNANIYLDITNAISLTNYMVQIPPNSYYESPFNMTDPIYGLSDIDNAEIYIREFI